MVVDFGHHDQSGEISERHIVFAGQDECGPIETSKCLKENTIEVFFDGDILRSRRCDCRDEFVLRLGRSAGTEQQFGNRLAVGFGQNVATELREGVVAPSQSGFAVEDQDRVSRATDHQSIGSPDRPGPPLDLP